MSSSQSMIKAWTHPRAGVPQDVLKLQSIPRPDIAYPTEVLVRVSYCALNPAGSIVMQLLPFIFRGSPAIPEMDFSGTVEEVGSEVPDNRGLTPGTKVFGSVPLRQHVQSTAGALAEYIVLDHSAVIRCPSHAELHAVAGLGIAGATAIALVDAARLKTGDKVLVNGASGGIGHLVLQMCQNIVGSSGSVVAICSTTNVDWIKHYGAQKDGRETNDEPGQESHRFEVIDYTQNKPFLPYLRHRFSHDRFDVIVDAIGIQGIFHTSPAILKEGKPYITVGPKATAYTSVGMLRTIWVMAKNMFLPHCFGGTPRPYIQVTAASTSTSLQRLAAMVEADEIRVHVGTSFSMSDVQDAYKSMLSGHAQGKIVVQVCDET